MCQAPSAPLASLASRGRLAPQARYVVLEPMVPPSTGPWSLGCHGTVRTPAYSSLGVLPHVHGCWVPLCPLCVFQGSPGLRGVAGPKVGVCSCP